MVDQLRILLIDDNEKSRHDLDTILSFLGESTLIASSATWQDRIAAAHVEAPQFCAALIGNCRHLELGELLNALHDWEAGLPYVLVGKQSQLESLDPALRNQVVAMVPGGIGYQTLLDALHKARLYHEHFNRLQDFGEIRDYNMFHSLVGNSVPVQRIRHMMGQVANKEVSVLITGESGTGKEVVARNLHLNSTRAEQPFIPINCGAIPRELLESELFGHEKGAFTGAIAARAGRFELADGGTLFLDEIGDMPLNMQVKLLRVLQERSFERVGGIKTIQTNVRIIAATHKDLEEMIEAGEFRQDLYYRLNVFPIEMPPLRERREDVSLLLNELITEMENDKRGSVRFNSAAITCLSQYSWPGNVRELANLVERMAILYPHGIVGVNELPEKLREFAGSEVGSTRESEPEFAGETLPLTGLDLKEYLSNLERSLIAQALDDCNGIVARAAERLNINRTTLVEKIRKYELTRPVADEDEDEKRAGDSNPKGTLVT